MSSVGDPDACRVNSVSVVQRTSIEGGTVMFNKTIAVALAATLGASALPAQGPASKEPTGKAAPSSKLELTPQSFAKLHALIRPQENEWRHLKVQWLTDVVAARKAAAEQDKPIVICYTGGAGYNEPLGVC